MPNYKTFFTKRFNLTALLIIGIIGGGIFSLFKLPVESSPQTKCSSLVTYSLTGDVTNFKLQKLAENLKKELEGMKEIENVQIIGLQEREIQINLIPGKLKKYSLTIENILSAISESNISIPLGLIESKTEKIPFKYEKEIKSIEEIENIQIGRLKLKDIAEIKEAFSDKETYSQIRNNEGRQKAISLLIYAKSGADILKTGDKTAKIVDEFTLKNRLKKNKIEIVKTNDLSSLAAKDISSLLNSGWQAFLIILIILLFAFSLKESIIAILTIPLSLSIVLISSNLRGLSINHINLLGMILSFGILISTAIVIIEGIHENLKKGNDPDESAIKSIKKFKRPIFTATLTRLAALIPLVFISGPTYKILDEMPLTLIIILSTAFLINLTLTPSLSSKFLKTPQKNENIIKFQQKKLNIKTWYGEKLKNLLKSNVKSTLLISYVLILFGLSMILPATGLLPRVLFPSTDPAYTNILIETKPGTSLQGTAEIINKIEEKLMTLPEIKLVLSNIDTRSNLSTIAINFKSNNERESKNYEIIPELKKSLKNIKAEITIKMPDGTINPINIETDNDRQNLEYLLVFDSQALAKYNLNPLYISNYVKNIFGYKEKLSPLKKGGKEINLVIQYKSDIKKTKESIEKAEILLPRGGTIPLSKIAKIEWQKTANMIEYKNSEKSMPLLGKINDLFDSLYIAVILIAIILVIMFNSLKQPLLILLTIPISLIGVFPAFYIFGIDLSFPAMIGIIALSGIVVNDAIILIDRINKTLENSGLPLIEAICEAAKSRLKPIFLTSSTTILGVLPLAFSDERWNAICISLIAGLIASTLGTLTMIPVLYNKFAKKNVRRSQHP